MIRRAQPASALVLLLLLVALPLPAADAEPQRVLLLTSPRVGELKNLVELADRGLLASEGLTVIGLSHAAEWTDYTAAHRWLTQDGPGWIELQTIDCDLAPETIFQQNACTDEFTRLFEHADGIVFSGGPDIPPGLYGQPTRLQTVIADPPRHLFEISFLAHLLAGDPKNGMKPLLDRRPDFLVLGLCLGMQTMNVATGGTLFQDIPSEVYGLASLEQYQKLPAPKRHRSAEAQLNPGPEVGWAHIHPVRFGKGPLAAALVPDGKPMPVVSLHHQAARKLGRGLKVLARSVDGKIVEAVGHQKYGAVLGVQFHPEKRVIFDADMIYRARVSDPVKNHIQASLSQDPRAMDFETRFWGLIQSWLTRSAGSRAEKTISPNGN